MVDEASYQSRPSAVFDMKVSADLTPDGYAYVQTVHVGPDVSIPLDLERAVRYAAALFDIAARADMESAVWRQLIEQVGMQEQRAVGMLREWRETLPPLDLLALEPLRAQPMLGASDGAGLVQMRLLTVPGSCTWTTAMAREHASQVLAGRAEPGLFQTYRRFLARRAELTDKEARHWVSQLFADA